MCAAYAGNFLRMKYFVAKIFVFGLLSLLFTVFVLINTYEVIFNRDIPFAYAVRKIDTQDVVNKEIKEFDVRRDNRAIGNAAALGDLEYLEIPSLKIRVSLEEARKIGNLWYQRPNVAHYVGLNKDHLGNIVDYLIYTDRSWRTLPYTNELGEGTEIKIHTTKGFSTSFVVSEKAVSPLEKSFIVNKTDNRQIVLIVDDPTIKGYYGYSLTMEK